jgi:hypothetical protein
VSITQVCEAGEASVLPPASVARTSNVCEPSASDVNERGDVQTIHAPPSIRHANVEPGWSAENSKSASTSLIGVVGAVSIVVSGATVSTSKERDVAPPTFPAVSTARTRRT